MNLADALTNEDVQAPQITREGHVTQVSPPFFALGPWDISPSTALHPPLCLPGCSL